MIWRSTNTANKLQGRMDRIMKTLVVEKDGSLSVREVSRPEYNECQALVKTLSCGICNGTDAKLFHQKFEGYDWYYRLRSLHLLLSQFDSLRMMIVSC